MRGGSVRNRGEKKKEGRKKVGWGKRKGGSARCEMDLVRNRVEKKEKGNAWRIGSGIWKEKKGKGDARRIRSSIKA